MKCLHRNRPRVSGGYAIAFDDLTSVQLHPWGDECEFVHHMKELSENPDIDLIESAVVEKVPPFVGKAIPSSSSFKLGYNYGFLVGVSESLAGSRDSDQATRVAKGTRWPARFDFSETQESTSRSC